MKVIRIDRHNPDPAMMALAVDVLKAGGVVIHPTDTCYGLAVDIHNEAAVIKLYAIKKMLLDKPTSVIIGNEDMLGKYAEVTPQVQKLISDFWPGALTIVTKKGSGLPVFYNRRQRTIGIRQPKCAVSLALVKGLGQPITTTSANISGQPSTYSLFEIMRQFENAEVKPDLVLDAGELDKTALVSTVVEVEGSGYKVLREGAIELKTQNSKVPTSLCELRRAGKTTTQN